MTDWLIDWSSTCLVSLSLPLDKYWNIKYSRESGFQGFRNIQGTQILCADAGVLYVHCTGYPTINMTVDEYSKCLLPELVEGTVKEKWKGV